MSFIFKIIGIFSLWLYFSTETQASKTYGLSPNRQVTQTHSLRIGGAHLLNTYLSPRNFTGLSLGINRQSMRPLKQDLWSMQTEISLTGEKTSEKTGNAIIYAIELNYNKLWYRNINLQHNLKFLLGGGIETFLGGMYHTRNGNNPGQVDLGLHIPLSVQFIYPFKCFNYPFTARAQLNIPIFGFQLTPHYTESYYETYGLKEPNPYFSFTWIGNAPSLSQLLQFSAPVPYLRGELCLGYVANVRQSKLENLKKHYWINMFQIGYVQHFILSKHYQYSPFSRFVY